MNKRISNDQEQFIKNSVLPKYSDTSKPQERRREEMNRRLGVLSYRRDRLAKELEAIDSALLRIWTSPYLKSASYLSWS